MSEHEDLTKFTPGNEVAEAQKDAAIAALTARVAEMEKDAARLDYLENPDRCYWGEFRKQPDGKTMYAGNGPGLRAAIDDAMFADSPLTATEVMAVQGAVRDGK